jgi:hypothetical protein
MSFPTSIKTSLLLGFLLLSLIISIQCIEVSVSINVDTDNHVARDDHVDTDNPVYVKNPEPQSGLDSFELDEATAAPPTRETCTMDERNRQECGYLGITQQQCIDRKCCFSPASKTSIKNRLNYPWCFKKVPSTPKSSPPSPPSPPTPTTPPGSGTVSVYTSSKCTGPTLITKSFVPQVLFPATRIAASYVVPLTEQFQVLFDCKYSCSNVFESIAKPQVYSQQSAYDLTTHSSAKCFVLPNLPTTAGYGSVSLNCPETLNKFPPC